VQEKRKVEGKGDRKGGMFGGLNPLFAGSTGGGPPERASERPNRRKTGFGSIFGTNPLLSALTGRRTSKVKGSNPMLGSKVSIHPTSHSRQQWSLHDHAVHRSQVASIVDDGDEGQGLEMTDYDDEDDAGGFRAEDIEVEHVEGGDDDDDDDDDDNGGDEDVDVPPELTAEGFTDFSDVPIDFEYDGFTSLPRKAELEEKRRKKAVKFRGAGDDDDDNDDEGEDWAPSPRAPRPTGDRGGGLLGTFIMRKADPKSVIGSRGKKGQPGSGGRKTGLFFGFGGGGGVADEDEDEDEDERPSEGVELSGVGGRGNRGTARSSSRGGSAPSQRGGGRGGARGRGRGRAQAAKGGGKSTVNPLLISNFINPVLSPKKEVVQNKHVMSDAGFL
jgi:hypothetical protein